LARPGLARQAGIGLAGRGLARTGGDRQARHNRKPFCTVNPYKAPNSSHTGYRVLWYRSVLDEMTKAA